jgi:hypothetical protein
LNNDRKNLLHLTEETRAKMSASRKGQIYTEERLAKMSASHIGKKHSEETKANLRASAKARHAIKKALLVA